jgi:hypothetical protein
MLKFLSDFGHSLSDFQLVTFFGLGKLVQAMASAEKCFVFFLMRILVPFLRLLGSSILRSWSRRHLNSSQTGSYQGCKRSNEEKSHLDWFWRWPCSWKMLGHWVLLLLRGGKVRLLHFLKRILERIRKESEHRS